MVQPFERALNQIAQNTSVMAEQLPIITDSVKKLYQVESEERNKEEKKAVEKERIEADTAGGKGDNAEILRELGGLAASMAGIRALLKNNLGKGEGGIGELLKSFIPGLQRKQEGGFIYRSPIQGFSNGGGVYTVPGNSTGDKHLTMLPVESFVLNRNASKFIDSLPLQNGGLVPTMLESGEKVFAPGSWDGLIPILNNAIPRFASGGLIKEHLHGEPGRNGYRDDHGGSNAHDHFAFDSKETRDYVMKELRALGYIIGSVDRPLDHQSYHSTQQAFDIPWSQFGEGPITEEDYRRSRQLLKDVNNILSKKNKNHTPGLTGLDFFSQNKPPVRVKPLDERLKDLVPNGSQNKNNIQSQPSQQDEGINMIDPFAKLFGFPTLNMGIGDLFPGFKSLSSLFTPVSNNRSSNNTASDIPISSNIIGSDMDLLKRLVAAEAGGEDLLGQALVARSVLNRQSLIQSGDASLGTFLANDASLRGIITGENQYQPMTDGRINNSFTEEQLLNAAKAIEIARNTADLRGRLEANGISAQDINNLVNSTGFRTSAAGYDESQDVNVTRYGNHNFNTAGNSLRGLQSSLSFSRSLNPIQELFQEANKTKMSSDQSNRQPIVIPIPQPVPMGAGTVNDDTSGSFTPQLPNEPSNHIASTLIMQTYALMSRIG